MKTARSITRSGLALIVILLVALATRVWYLWYYSSLPDWRFLGVDNYYYHNWASSMAGGHVLGDTTYFRAPFYAYCLASLYALFGASLWAARLFGIAIGVVSVFLTYLIGRRMFNSRAGLVAAALQACHPVAIYYGEELLADSLLMLLVQLALYLLLCLEEDARPKHLLVTGLSIGLATITRPVAALLVPVALWLVWRKTRSLKGVVVLVAGVVLLVAPITVRNLVVAHDPVIIASQGGINWYVGNHAGADGCSASLPEPLGYNWTYGDIADVAETDEHRRPTPGEVSAHWTHKADQWILGHPVEFLKLFARKLYWSVAPFELFNDRDLDEFFAKIPFFRLNPLSFPLVLILSVTGILFSIRNNRMARWMSAFAAGFMIVSSLFFMNSRFRLPVLPVLFAFAAFTLVYILEQLRTNARRSLTAAALTLILAPIAHHAWLIPEGAVSVQPQMSRAKYFYSLGEYRRALDINRQALAVAPSFPELNLNIGACYLKLGQVDSALLCFQREQTLHPDRARAYCNIASILNLQGKDSLALTTISRALALRPHDVVANRLLLRVIADDSTTTTIALYDSTLAAMNRSRGGLAVLNEGISALLDRRDVERAKLLVTMALAAVAPPVETDDGTSEQLFPNGPVAFTRERAHTCYLAAAASGLAGEYANAIRCSERAIALNPDAAESYGCLISSYAALGNNSAADSVMLQAQLRFPHFRQPARP